MAKKMGIKKWLKWKKRTHNFASFINFGDFTADTSHGRIESFHEWMCEDKWAVLFSHPADFTPVCTTELARAAQLFPEFEKRNVKMIALSCDSIESHSRWLADIAKYGNENQRGDAPKIDAANFPFPIIGDVNRNLASKLGMLDPLNLDMAGIPMTVRAVFIIDSKKRLRLQILYPASTGRNFDELLRVIDSMQLSDKHMLATPEGWLPGTPCIIEPRMSDEQANELFGGKEGNGIKKMELPSGKTYIRIVEQPREE